MLGTGEVSVGPIVPGGKSRLRHLQTHCDGVPYNRNIDRCHRYCPTAVSVGKAPPYVDMGCTSVITAPENSISGVTRRNGGGVNTYWSGNVWARYLIGRIETLRTACARRSGWARGPSWPLCTRRTRRTGGARRSDRARGAGSARRPGCSCCAGRPGRSYRPDCCHRFVGVGRCRPDLHAQHVAARSQANGERDHELVCRLRDHRQRAVVP